jgi:hypothetical protein
MRALGLAGAGETATNRAITGLGSRVASRLFTTDGCNQGNSWKARCAVLGLAKVQRLALGQGLVGVQHQPGGASAGRRGRPCNTAGDQQLWMALLSLAHVGPAE